MVVVVVVVAVVGVVVVAIVDIYSVTCLLIKVGFRRHANEFTLNACVQP